MNIDKKVLNKYELSIEEIKPKVLESIVNIYGEKHRTQIEKALNSIYINSYITYEDITRTYQRNQGQFKDMTSLNFLKEYGVEITKEEEDAVYKGGIYYLAKDKKEIIEEIFGWDISDDSKIFSFDDEKLNPENGYFVESILQKRCDILKFFGVSATPANYYEIIESNEGKKAMEQIHKVYNIALNCKEEMDIFKEKNKDILDYIKSGEELKQELNAKYTRKYYEEIKPYLSKEEQDNIDKMLAMPNLNGIYLCDPNYIYSGSYLLKSFSEESDELIKKDNWEADTIKSKRVKYFKAKGLDLGEDYSAYEKSEEAKKLTPSRELVNKILEIKEQNDNAKDKEFLFETSNYLDNKAKLDDFNFLLETGFNINFVKDGVKCLTPNVVRNENGEYNLSNIIHLPVLNMLQEYGDVFIVHELLHAVETTMQPINDKKFKIKTGFEFLEESVKEGKENDDDENNKDIRPYELLSENIHQLLAIQVVEDMHKKGIYLMDDPRISKERGGASYEQLNCVTFPFFGEFRQAIVDTRMSESMELLYDSVGRDNFEALNQTVTEYRNLPYLKMMNQVINHENTDLTRKREELIEKGQTIAEHMKEYQREHKIIDNQPIEQYSSFPTQEEGKNTSFTTQSIGKATIHTPTASKDKAQGELEKIISDRTQDTLDKGDKDIDE